MGSKPTPISHDQGGDVTTYNSDTEPNCQVPVPTMSASVDGDDSYLGQDLSISQLLQATKRKLWGTAFGRWFVWWLVGGHLPMY